MKNIENKKISILAIIIAVILIAFFSIIKVDTELTEKISGDTIITTTSKIMLFGEEYNFESSIALCFIIILVAVIAYFFTDDKEIEDKVKELRSNTIKLFTTIENKQNRNKLIGFILAISFIILCFKALFYYIELKDLEKDNPYYVYNAWQASFMGFMKVGQFALPISVLYILIGTKKRKK